MPVTKQAEKKLRRDKSRSKQNASKRLTMRDLVKSMRKNPSKKTLASVFQILDKNVKTHVIHANKSARLKARLSKLILKK